MIHHSHPAVVKRLRQAHGHLAAILAMFADTRPCLELAQQLQAVESAVHAAKRMLIEDHMAHCITDSVAAGGIAPDAAMSEFKALAKYL